MTELDLLRTEVEKCHKIIADQIKMMQTLSKNRNQWVGLTEIEICDIEGDELTSASIETFSFARAIEAKLKEKNT